MNQNKMIDGVVIEPLKVIEDERGKVMHMMSSSSPLFRRFGEVYFSTINSGVVKAWKLHNRMTQHFSVPRGNLLLVLYDNRPKSPSRGAIQSIEMGESNYCLVRVPPLIWYGFKADRDESALIANCTDIPHDPSEIERCDPLSGIVPYQWTT